MAKTCTLIKYHIKWQFQKIQSNGSVSIQFPSCLFDSKVVITITIPKYNVPVLISSIYT